MRAFWVLIALLCIAAAIAVVARRGHTVSDPPIVQRLPTSPASAVPVDAAPITAPPAPIQIAVAPPPTPAPAPIAAPPAAPVPEPAMELPRVAPSPVADVPPAATPPDPAGTAPTPDAPLQTATTAPPAPTTTITAPPEPKTAPVAPTTPSPATAPPPQPTEAPKPAAPSTETSADIAAGIANLVGDGAKAAESTAPAVTTPAPLPPAEKAGPKPAPKPAKIEPQPDGTVLVDDKYVMKGAGTRDDPYRVTWEQLVSAEDTYQPRLGRTNIPQRVKMLDGKHVRISGYIAFPLMAQSADEMLMMLNQWDGCCIGVPPTPYDAIEVKLKSPAKGDDRLRTTGTLTGILKVEPYLVKNWLVSLFVMDNGELSDAKGSADVSQHAK